MNITQEDVKNIVVAIHKNSEFNFEYYSILSLSRRIDKILYDLQLDVDTLINKIDESKDFCRKVAKLILVSTTEFFRDPQLWQILKHKALSRFAKKEKINIWHAGCSSGQEVYSMLMILNELELIDKVNILATDINQDLLEKAKLGEYNYKYNSDCFHNFNEAIRKNPFNKNIYNEVPYSRHFETNKIKKTIKVHENLRKKPVWIQHDLVNWTNIFDEKFDIIICRNVLIYFNIIVQLEIIEHFYNNLLPNSLLVLGTNEDVVGPLANHFVKKELYYTTK